ncbi:MFS transporter [Alicyclobacillus tolerans]|uniref:MFS transporter n=1 Tax=Alicyclobacillus tolerans TaxID=90970 RepID=UPI001F0209B6|nr:MFS transporter [Alicyclobacillus tolerans]MCF8568468.1 MFS transporter [Alicyclobacillus tolerans]
MPATAIPSDNSNARHMLLTTSISWIWNLADRAMIGPLLPLIVVYFHIPLALAGFVVSIFFIGYLSTAFSGWLSDRYGRKKLIVTSVTGFGVVTGLTALAPAVWFIMIIRILTGLFEGAQYPTGVAWVNESFPRERRARAIGIFQMAGNFGSVVGIVVASVVGAHFGWRGPWLVMVIPTLLTALWIAKTVREIPRTQTPAYKEVEHSNQKTQGKYSEVFRVRNVWVGFLLHGLFNFANWGLASWIPLYMIKVKHMGFTSAGLLSAVFTIGIALGMYVSGWVADKWGRRLTTSIWALLGIPLLLGFLHTSNIMVAIICIFLTGFFGNGWLGNVLTMIGDSITPNLAGSANGVVMFGAEIGAVLGPLVGGIIAQSIGLARGLNYYTILYLLAGIIIWLGADMKGGVKYQQSMAVDNLESI